jgi:YesN/AraC family two-component response regulator
MLSSTISQIVLDVLRKSDIKAQNLSHTPVQAAIFYIMRNFRKDISINSAAEEICLTPKYLGAVFKENTKSSFHEYLNRVRLKYACNMLKSSDISIKEINVVKAVFKKHLQEIYHARIAYPAKK